MPKDIKIEVDEHGCTLQQFDLHFKKKERNNQANNKAIAEFINLVRSNDIPYSKINLYEGYESIRVKGSSHIIQLLAMLDKFEIVTFVDCAPFNFQERLYRYLLNFPTTEENINKIEPVRAESLGWKVITLADYYRRNTEHQKDKTILSSLEKEVEKLKLNKSCITQGTDARFTAIMNLLKFTYPKISNNDIKQRLLETYRENLKFMPLRDQQINIVHRIENGKVILDFHDRSQFKLICNELSGQGLLNHHVIINDTHLKISLQRAEDTAYILHYLTQNLSTSEKYQQFYNEVILKINFNDISLDNLKLFALCYTLHRNFYNKLKNDLMTILCDSNNSSQSNNGLLTSLLQRQQSKELQQISIIEIDSLIALYKGNNKNADKNSSSYKIKTILECIKQIDQSAHLVNAKISPFILLIAELISHYDNIVDFLKKNNKYSTLFNRKKSKQNDQLIKLMSQLHVCINKYKHFLPEDYLISDDKTKTSIIDRTKLPPSQTNSLNNLPQFS